MIKETTHFNFEYRLMPVFDTPSMFIKPGLLKTCILYFILLCSQINFCQSNDILKTYETADGKIIMLLADQRVLLEVSGKVSYPDSTNVISITKEGKAICGLRISEVSYQNYGFYKYENQKLILLFRDENPIEDIAVKFADTDIKGQSIRVSFTNNYHPVFDLKVFQKDKLLCSIDFFAENCSFTTSDLVSPLVFNYNGNLKTLPLTSKPIEELIVTINDLKGDNQIKIEKIAYNLKDLIEK
ncbi:hypothetical protein [Leeuwenhoekiella nanhaiensis]|uniref:Uncharacterized protein n=1 Tax=Leeuwenhoekiella nanhaiensis TaxID=1655491 RepID=A0A2G1VUM8_9FLAO|nr:hypothetical protein [Leeuwenhoekiella nanhaiensis]PHQ30320.1 hypothetical protein CJ305_04980 [Leeuwenhoekiella nanhaiensis]